MPVVLLLQALRKSHARITCRDTAVILRVPMIRLSYFQFVFDMIQSLQKQTFVKICRFTSTGGDGGCSLLICLFGRSELDSLKVTKWNLTLMTTEKSPTYKALILKLK